MLVCKKRRVYINTLQRGIPNAGPVEHMLLTADGLHCMCVCASVCLCMCVCTTESLAQTPNRAKVGCQSSMLNWPHCCNKKGTNSG